MTKRAYTEPRITEEEAIFDDECATLRKDGRKKSNDVGKT